MASIHIHVPDKLKAMMKKHKLNWSHGACCAFIQQLAIAKANIAIDQGVRGFQRSAMYQMEKIREQIKS